MRNEMGNQNTSGIRAEEKAVDEVPEEAHEAGDEDKVMKGENSIIPGDQTEAFQEKAEDLPSHYQSAAADTSGKSQESDKKEQGGKESDSDELPEASMESNNSVSQVDCIEKDDLSYESNMENIMPVNDKLQIHDQYQRETIEQQAESSRSNSVAKSVQDSNPADGSTSPLEECPNLSSEDSEEAKKLSETYHMQKEKKNGDCMDTKDSIVDLVLEESVLSDDKQSGRNVDREKCENGIEEIVENDQGNYGNVEVPLKVNSNDIPSSPIETVPEVSSPSPLAACPEPQEKHIVHAEEMKMTPVKSENIGQNRPVSDQAQSSETVNQLDLASASEVFQEDFCKENNGDENTVSSSSDSDLEKVLSAERDKVIHNGNKGISGQEQRRNTEEIVGMPEIVSLSNKSGTIDKYDEATEKYFLQETEKRTQEPWSTRKRTRGRGTSQGFHSFGVENELHTSQINSHHHDLDAAYPTSSIHSLSSNGTLTGSGAAEDQNKFTVSLKENISYEILVNAQNAYMQTPKDCNNVQELPQKVQMKSGTVALTETSLSQSNKQIMAEETSPLPSSKALQESTARFSVDSNPDHPSHRLQLRKSPSFEFGLPLDARSEESDQTPLLLRDKSLARSFSGSAKVKFQNTMLPSDYGRKSLDYEPIQVEEKTIRMERSTSDISRDSFVNFLKKDAKASVEHTSEKQDSHSAEEKALESPSQELALPSVKANGKRKPRSSLFSACICCSAAIH